MKFREIKDGKEKIAILKNDEILSLTSLLMMEYRNYAKLAFL